MDELLSEGDELTAKDRRVIVSTKLGAGGQGTVYRVKTDVGDMALKWYFRQTATPQQRDIIERLVDLRSPDQRFLWPRALVTSERVPGFGYLMDLTPERYVGLPKIFRRRVKTTPRALVSACIAVVEAYRTLHSMGIAYRDISWGNVLLDPQSGDVLVCDNDNAVFEGHDTNIAGTMMFMAPELVREEPGVRPSTQTDLHALAVLLFMMLMNAHPLEGQREYDIHCMDLNAQKSLYGGTPVFVFDPNDDSNRPVAGEHDTVVDAWKAAPTVLKTLFRDAFTKGLHSPNDRVREFQWLQTLSRVRDSIVHCGVCNRQNYHDELAYQRTRYVGNCWHRSCRKPLVLPPRMTIGERAVMLSRDAQVFIHHFEHTPRHDFSAVVAAVTAHPQKSGVFGLTNRDELPWSVEWPNGTKKTIVCDQTIPLRSGLRLRIRRIDAEIRSASD